ADLVVLVADGSSDDDKLDAHLAAVRDVLAQIGAGELPIVLALNKIDRMGEAARIHLQRRHPDAVLVAARTGENLDGLMDRIAQEFANRWERVELIVPYADAGILSELYDAGAPVQRSDEEDGIHASAHLPKRLISRIQQFRVDEPTPTAKVQS
ncbi:MAG: GTP-binding protein HflX, partial [Thermoleophilia bacterium]|nr:GTP-binding protein HflX [Thermoleophilia bacterium]